MPKQPTKPQKKNFFKLKKKIDIWNPKIYVKQTQKQVYFDINRSYSTNPSNARESNN